MGLETVTISRPIMAILCGFLIRIRGIRCFGFL